MRAQKVVFKSDGSKKMLPVNGSTVRDLLASLAPLDTAETEDGFELDGTALLDALLGAPIVVSQKHVPPVVAAVPAVAAAPAPVNTL